MPTIGRRILPGFYPSVTLTLAYLGVLLVIPLVCCFIKVLSLTPAQFIDAVWTERARSAYALTFGASFIAATINCVLGLLIAWVLVRYPFPLKRLFDSLIDLPFALPTAVAGLVYSSLYVRTGWFGQFLAPLGIEAVHSRLAIVLVLTFVGLPFTVRTVQPVLEGLGDELEEAAAALGANRWQTFLRVILPEIRPALWTGFVLAFARALGEYGSVIFVSGNMPFRTEIAPVLIVSRLEEFAYSEATAIAVVLLAASFAMLLIINVLERRSRAYDA
jgi:sulfate transport system permease protein